jgi:spore maturation protein CgeB
VSGGIEPVDVVVIGPDHLDLFAANIADGFDDLGIAASVVDPLTRSGKQRSLGFYHRYRSGLRNLAAQVPPLSAVRQGLVDRHMVASLRELSPRLVVCVDGSIPGDQVARWRDATAGATWVLWYPDHLANLGPHRALLAPYDHLFFKDRYLVERLACRAGLPAHYLAQACNPRHHRPSGERDRVAGSDCDVVLVGNPYAYRLLTLENLAADVDLKIYGNGKARIPTRFSRLADAHTGRPVFGADKARVFGAARIVLSTMHYGEIDGVNSRLFEATGSGGFVLTHDSPALDRYFERGTEIAVFNSPDDLDEAIAEYLADPDGRREIAARGMARTHGEHTYPHRLRQLLRTCGLGEEPPFDRVMT